MSDVRKFILETSHIHLKDQMFKDAKNKFKHLFEVDSQDFRFSFEAAVYWLANNYHSGQYSDGYKILSTSDYKPARSESSIGDTEDAEAGEIYYFLEDKYKDKM